MTKIVASAMRHFEAAIEANPHFPEPRFGKALLLKNQGHLDAATETLESLLRDTSPGDARSNPVIQTAEQLLASIQKEIRERGGPTNPELLQEKYPAAVWHLLDALKRFDSLDPRRVMEITFEIARLGESLSRRHKDTEKTSRPERRRPRRHQQFTPLTAATSRNPIPQNTVPILALAGFKRVFRAIKYQELMPDPL